MRYRVRYPVRVCAGKAGATHPTIARATDSLPWGEGLKRQAVTEECRSGVLGHSIAVRPIGSGDVEAVWRPRRLPTSLSWTLVPPSVRVRAIRQRIEVEDPDDHGFVADLDGSLVGMAWLHVGRGKRRHAGEIGMMVHDDMRGRDIGRQLRDAPLDVADTYLGLVRVELEALMDNQSAIRLYDRAGYEHEGRKRRAVFSGGRLQDILVMARLRPLLGSSG